MKKEIELINEEQMKNCDCENQETFTIDDIGQLLEEITPKVDINIEEVNNTPLDKSEFIKGVKSVSYICGQYSALKNVGIENGSCIDIIVSLMNSKHNLEMNKMTCDNNISVSKIQQVQMEKTQL